MAFKTFADSVTLPASDLNTYLMKQSVIVCTSGTRPSSPNEGMKIYETDTDRELNYTTATTTWRQPWNMPWGYITQTSSQATTSGITSEADVVTATWTAVANRRYKLTFYVTAVQQTVDSSIITRITDNATVGVQLDWRAVGVGFPYSANLVYTIAPVVSGSLTYRGRIGTVSGSLTLQGAAQGCTHLLLVEDIGPSGAPA